MLNSNFSGRGFTLIEVIIVLGILSLFLAIGLYSFSSLRQTVNLSNAALGILDALRLARSKTLAAENALNHGVHFESNKYIIFSGTSYNPLASDNIIFNLISDLEIYNINFNGGGGDIIFNKISGTTNNFGSLAVKIISNPSKFEIINVGSLGNVYLSESGSLIPIGSRISDSRHLYFNLGWSIQNSNTLTFIFSDPPNPDNIQNIAMANYFNPQRTNFSYQGTFSVGGNNQTLKVHTHFLDVVNTILSIHRDKMENTKAVKILIDNKEIVSYTASGQAALGIYGGVMEEQ